MQGFPWYLITGAAASQVFKTALPKNVAITASHFYAAIKILESLSLEEP